MGYKVNNAIIMAAGMSSRFTPISYEKPKALIPVKGEVLIERQIQQLREKGINDIFIVVGYLKEQFYYLKEKYSVFIVENPDYLTRNNHSSIYAVRKYLANSYICSADDYFETNPFETFVEESYYAAEFSPSQTDEWCLKTDENDWITDINIGGSGQWYMIGHVFWSELFSRNFVKILESVYAEENTRNKLWEDIFKENIDQLKMKIRRYPAGQIYEFDTLDELQKFDHAYQNKTYSQIMKMIVGKDNNEKEN